MVRQHPSSFLADFKRQMPILPQKNRRSRNTIRNIVWRGATFNCYYDKHRNSNGARMGEISNCHNSNFGTNIPCDL